MPTLPSASPGHFLLTLDNQPVIVKSVDGGNIKGEVVTIDQGPRQAAQKRISTLILEPFTIAVGMSMGKPMVEWVRASFDLSPTRKSGSVVSASFDYKAQGYRHFRDALITEITFPGMDASNKEPAYFTIRFAPEEITYAKGDGAIVKGIVNTKPKNWLGSNFRLRVGDLPCTRVTKVNSFTIKQGNAKDAVGAGRGLTMEPTSVEIPNLTITLSAADLDPWQNWFTEFVIRGNNDPSRALQGALEFLDPATQEVLGSLELSQVGIFSLSQEKLEANRDAIARFSVELYVEKMTFNLKSF